MVSGPGVGAELTVVGTAVFEEGADVMSLVVASGTLVVVAVEPAVEVAEFGLGAAASPVLDAGDSLDMITAMN